MHNRRCLTVQRLMTTVVDNIDRKYHTKNGNPNFVRPIQVYEDMYFIFVCFFQRPNSPGRITLTNNEMSALRYTPPIMNNRNFVGQLPPMCNELIYVIDSFLRYQNKKCILSFIFCSQFSTNFRIRSGYKRMQRKARRQRIPNC